MLLIHCPYCGERPEIEFSYGGQAHLARPARPAASSDDDRAAYLYLRANPRGRKNCPTTTGRLTCTCAPPRAACTPSAGVTCAAAGASSTRCATPRATASPAPTRSGSARRERIPDRTGRARRPRTHSSFPLRRRGLRGTCRRHAGLRAAGEWRSPRRALVQVPPAARHRHGRDRKSTRLNSSHLVISYAV